MSDNLSTLSTESRNPSTLALDTMSAEEIVKIINENDKTVADAVSGALGEISRAVRAAADSFKNGGRLIYIGAGTSGRLGVLDASECPPTYSAAPGQVIGLIAGGRDAMFEAVEGAEDSLTLAAEDLSKLGLNKNDTVVGIAASGRTPYVIGGLDYAGKIGAKTVALSCVPDAEISAHAEIGIEAVTGAEVVSGSTRMKAGTAQKMVLNMISTGAFVLSGKVYSNLMVDVRATNSKLHKRALRIIRSVIDVDEACAEKLLADSGNSVKTAIVMGRLGCSLAEAEDKLQANSGCLRGVIG